MSIPAVFVAALGLGLAIYAAMETEPEDIRQRAAYGLLGLLILTVGVMLI